jgi:membrane-associated protease RseP (regulator of RpoE activity)
MDPITFLLIIGFAWISLNTIARIRWFDVKNPEIGLGYAFYRTTRLNQLIDRISKRGPIIWKFIWDIGIISGLGILFFGLIIFTVNIPLFFISAADGTGETTAIALTPVIPGITISFGTLPYVLIAIMIAAIVHEFGHGIAARVENIKLKSTGLFLFLVFFGAFVEPDEKSYQKKSRRSKMRVMAAGALSNMIITGIVFIIIILPVFFPLLFAPSLPVFLTPFYHSEPSGALIVETIPKNPASTNGIKAGFIIIKINTSETVQEISSSSDFSEFVNSSILPNQNITIHFADNIGPITLQTITNPYTNESSTGFIGVKTYDYFQSKFFSSSTFINFIPYWTFYTLLYVFMINLILAIFNLLPVPFLDGDKMLASFLGPKFKKYLSWIRYFALGVLGINLILSFVFFGWQQI